VEPKRSSAHGAAARCATRPLRRGWS
jgi:hypothetical protein